MTSRPEAAAPLERAGYARRCPDQADRRRLVVEVTEATKQRDLAVFGRLVRAPPTSSRHTATTTSALCKDSSKEPARSPRTIRMRSQTTRQPRPTHPVGDLGRATERPLCCRDERGGAPIRQVQFVLSNREHPVGASTSPAAASARPKIRPNNGPGPRRRVRGQPVGRLVRRAVRPKGASHKCPHLHQPYGIPLVPDRAQQLAQAPLAAGPLVRRTEHALPIVVWVS
jgi:hypothetical protein